jgi:hypothetical protein
MKNINGGRVLVISVLIFSSLFLFKPGLCAADTTRTAIDSTLARVLEFNTSVTINRAEQKTVSGEMRLYEGDTLTVPEKGSVTLLLKDGRVRQIKGPARVAVGAELSETDDNMLAKLTSALLNLFFADEKEQEDAYLFVRDPMNNNPAPVSVPPLVFPPNHCRLVDIPGQLRWRPVNGVYLYRISIYDSQSMLWQGTTNRTTLDLPTGDFKFSPGNTYLWMVEAQVGEANLCSPQADFYILSEDEKGTLNRQLAEIDSARLDNRLKAVLKTRFYRDRNLKVDCYREIQSLLKSYPNDYSFLLMKAELLREMGLYEDAMEVYRSIVR